MSHKENCHQKYFSHRNGYCCCTCSPSEEKHEQGCQLIIGIAPDPKCTCAIIRSGNGMTLPSKEAGLSCKLDHDNAIQQERERVRAEVGKLETEETIGRLLVKYYAVLDIIDDKV